MLHHRQQERHPNDPEKPFVTSGIRVGTPAATTRGLKEEDMKEIARIMGMVARDFEGSKEKAQEAVVALTKKYPIYESLKKKGCPKGQPFF